MTATRIRSTTSPVSTASHGLPASVWLVEPAVALAATLLASSGGTWMWFALLAVPALWLVRRLWVGGRPFVRTPYDRAVAVLLLSLPLCLLPVVDWTAAAPKLAGILGGLMLIYALARAGGSASRLVVLASLAALLLDALIVGTGLAGTSWSAAEKIGPIQPLVRHLPLRLHPVSRGSSNGGVNPNEVGGGAVLILPLAIAVAWGRRDPVSGPFARLQSVALLLGAALLTCVLVISQSRSAYAGLLCEAVFCTGYLLTRRFGRHARTVAIVAATLGGLVPALGVWLAATGSLTDASGLDSLASRLELWQRSLRMVGDFPLTGIGPGQFDLVLHRLFPPLLVRGDVYVAHAHNWFLQLALDLGLIGAFAMLGLLRGFARGVAVAASRSTDPRLRRLALALAAGMLGYCVFGLTDAIALGARGGLGFWIVLGLGAALWRTIAHGHRPPEAGTGKPGDARIKSGDQAPSFIVS